MTLCSSAAVAVVALLSLADGARILCLMSTPSRSHHIFNRALTLALAARGHHVTVLTPDLEQRPVPNLREVFVERAYDGLHDEFQYEAFARMSYLEDVRVLFDWGVTTCERALHSEGGRRLLQLASNETFDLVIAEVVLNECLLGYVAKFGNPPLVGITAYSSPPWANYLVGNFLNPSYVNTHSLPYTDHMTFFQRMANFLLDRYVMLVRHYSYLPRQDEISRKFFGDSVPPVSEIEKNFSLVMVNAHFSTHYPQPLVPAIVQIGGLQTRPPKPLPKDIEKFLDESEAGAVFFSLGSNIRSDELVEDAIRALLAAFSKLPQRVLWKFESDDLPGKPPNVKIAKWLPQNDILAHRRVLAFVTHGGMLSTMEAVYHGVPMVGVPFLADQYANLGRGVALGVALVLPPSELNEQSVLHALGTVLNDSSYRERARRLSAVFRDRPQTALETAVYWTEYALRHGGARHLRCASLDLAWPQRLLLDVGAALLAAAAALYLAARLLLRAACARARAKLKSS